MLGSKACCKDCPERHPGCQDHCESYLVAWILWQAEQADLKRHTQADIDMSHQLKRDDISWRKSGSGRRKKRETR